MTTRSYRETLVAWTSKRNKDPYRTTGAVETGPLIERGKRDWTLSYQMTGGAAYVAIRKADKAQATIRMLVDAMAMIIRDGIDPQAVHREFLKIDEYIDRMAIDVPGVLDAVKARAAERGEEYEEPDPFAPFLPYGKSALKNSD